MVKEPTNQEILEAINEFANGVDKRFDGVDKRFDGVDKRLDGVDKRLDKIESRVNKIESKMVTKDHLDEKLADLRGDLVVIVRKEDKKIISLVEILEKRKLISKKEAKKILAMEPFPHLFG